MRGNPFYTAESEFSDVGFWLIFHDDKWVCVQSPVLLAAIVFREIKVTHR